MTATSLWCAPFFIAEREDNTGLVSRGNFFLFSFLQQRPLHNGISDLTASEILIVTSRIFINSLLISSSRAISQPFIVGPLSQFQSNLYRSIWSRPHSFDHHHQWLSCSTTIRKSAPGCSFWDVSFYFLDAYSFLIRQCWPWATFSFCWASLWPLESRGLCASFQGRIVSKALSPSSEALSSYSCAGQS